MFDYSTYLLGIDRLTTKIHDDIVHRRFGEAERDSMELLINARQLQLWLMHQHQIERDHANQTSELRVEGERHGVK